MSFAKKVVVAVNITENLSNQLNLLRELDFLKDSYVDFVHISQTVSYSLSFGDFSFLYPVPEDRNAIKEGVISYMEKHIPGCLPQDFSGKFFTHCLFSENPKKELCRYAKQVHADLIIVLTRDKHGLFESSFAHFVSKHSDINLLQIKVHEEEMDLES